MLNSFASLPFPVTPVPTLDDAARLPFDALLTGTSAAEPFIYPALFRPGTLLLQIGYHEAAFDTIALADRVVVDA